MIKYTSYTKDVFKDLETAEQELIKEASIHVRDAMKETAGRLFKKRSGNLIKGLSYNIIDRDTALVGPGPKAYHAHLLELGTIDRKTKKGHKKGRITKTPFIIPTFMEETQAVINIMRRQWI